METTARKNKKNFSLAAPHVMLKLGSWRQPFVMVDRIIDFKKGSRSKITAIKNVAANEPQFTGHYPDFPVMPGVLIAEGFGQTSEYLTLMMEFMEIYKERKGEELADKNAIRDALVTEEGMGLIAELRANTLGYLASQDLKFKGVVIPGDTLEFHSEIHMEDQGFIHFNVEALVGNKVVCSGRISNWRGKLSEGLSKMS